MQLGFGLVTGQRRPDDPEERDAATVIQQGVELARLADERGLGSVWVSEHHFADDGYLPAPLVLLGAMAQATSSIALGTGILLAPLWDPIRLAEDAAAVDLLSEGRLVLGLGLGWRDEEFAGFGVSRHERVRRLEETVDTLRRAWAGELAPGRDVAVRPLPARSGGPPLWLGGYAEAALERAERMADGHLAAVMGLDEARARLARFRALDRPFGLGAHVPVFVWDGPEDPWALAADHLWYVRWKYDDLRAHQRRTGPPPTAPAPSDEALAKLRRRSIVGRPKEVCGQLRAYRDAVGDDGHLIARAYYPGLPWAVQRRQVELLGEIAEEVADTSRDRSI